MAGDIRDTTNAPPTSHPSLGTSLPPKTYETFNAPPPTANALPVGMSQNTAGAHVRQPTFWDAIQTIKLEDFTKVHLIPCARESLMTGIGAGFGIGGVRALFGGSIPKSCNWAVGSFVFASLANYEFCLYRRRLEKSYVARCVEIMDEKKAKKAQKDREKAEQEMRVRREEAERKAAEEAARRKWRFW